MLEVDPKKGSGTASKFLLNIYIYKIRNVNDTYLILYCNTLRLYF